MTLNATSIESMEVLAKPHLQVNHSMLPPAGLYVAGKVMVDWVLALLLLLPTAMVVGIFALAVRMESRGPALYKQRRVGRDRSVFWIYKLRSMKHNCEAATGAIWSSGQDDPRVTRIGRFLRDTHLDELPQLWNVLRGQMSLIGPRPERPELIADLEDHVPHYADRLLVKPGLTGLAQTQLPPDSDVNSVKKKLAYDRYYVQRLSLGLDLRIALCTVFYMSGALAQSLGRLLVKQYGNEIERDYNIDRIEDQQAAGT